MQQVLGQDGLCNTNPRTFFTAIVHCTVFGWWNFQTVGSERVADVATALCLF
jgi:hypothetical protein